MSKISVRDLITMLANCPQEAEVYFGGLDFSRVKRRSENCIQIEFEQQVYKDEHGDVHIDNLQ